MPRAGSRNWKNVILGISWLNQKWCSLAPCRALPNFTPGRLQSYLRRSTLALLPLAGVRRVIGELEAIEQQRASPCRGNAGRLSTKTGVVLGLGFAAIAGTPRIENGGPFAVDLRPKWGRICQRRRVLLGLNEPRKLRNR
jgi:hypothetical protein